MLFVVKPFRILLLGADSKAGSHSKLRQSVAQAGTRSAIQLARFLKAQVLTSRVRSDAILALSRTPARLDKESRDFTSHSLDMVTVGLKPEAIVRLYLDSHALQTHDQTC